MLKGKKVNISARLVFKGDDIKTKQRFKADKELRCCLNF